MGKQLSTLVYRLNFGALSFFELRAPLELRQSANSQAEVAHSNQQCKGTALTTHHFRVAHGHFTRKRCAARTAP